MATRDPAAIPATDPAEGKRRAFAVSVQRSRAIVYSVATCVAAIAKLFGVLAGSWWAIIFFFAVANVSALLFGALYRRAPVSWLGVPLQTCWMAFDVAVITGQMWLSGGSASSWYVWYLANVTAAVFVAGRTAAVVVMIANTVAYTGLVVATEPVSARLLTEVVGKMALLYGAAFFALLGIGDLRVKRRTIAALREQEREHTQELTESRERFRRLSDAAFEGIVVTDQGRIVDVNAQLGGILRCTPAELIGRSALDFVDPANHLLVSEHFRSGSQDAYEHFMVRADGARFPAEAQGRPFLYGGKTLRVTAIRDITERKRAEQALRTSEERQALILRSMPVAVYTALLGHEADATWFSENVRQLTGFSAQSFIEEPHFWRERIHPEDRERTLEAFRRSAENGHASVEYRWQVADGSYRWFLDTAAVRSADSGRHEAVGTFLDVTERKRMEEQLRQAQKIEAVGRLAGGVAHDFNNLLQALLSQVQLLHARSSGRERNEGLITEIEQGIKRGASLTRQLLLFSRHETPRPERLDLNQVVSEAGALLRPLLRENIAMVRDFSPQPLLVQGDRGQLEQVLLNLAINAADAMPEGGRLTLRTLRSGDEEVSLEVCDNGGGIPPGVSDHMFEPFFTTKSPDRGTGLGLSVVHRIIAQHGGRIEVDSAVGRGSTFRVVLPNAACGESQAVATAVRDQTPLADGRGERVLVVEDEEAARDALRGILTSLGYKVVTAGSGEDAGRLPAEEPFDVLLTDVMLPGIAGPELAHGLAARWPGLRVILMSGYTEDEAVRHDIATGKVRFLQKPFDMATLAQEIRASLEE